MMFTNLRTTEIDIDGSAHSVLEVERGTDDQVIFADTAEQQQLTQQQQQ